MSEMSKHLITIACPNEACDGSIEIDENLTMLGKSFTCATCGEMVGMNNTEEKNKEAFRQMVELLKDKKK